MQYINSYEEFIEKINESRYKTHKIYEILGNLSRRLSGIGLLSVIEPIDDYNFKISITRFNNKHVIDSILSVLQLFGYFPMTMTASFDFDIIDGRFDRDILVSKMETLKLQSLYMVCRGFYNAKLINKPDKVYHTTLSINVPDILRIGLIPKATNGKSYYTERIYFAYSIETCSVLKYELMQWNYNKIMKLIELGKDSSYSILEIDLSELNIELYEDTEFKTGGCYTLSNIPPKYINLLNNEESIIG